MERIVEIRTRIDGVLPSQWTVMRMDASGAVHLAFRGHYQWTIQPYIAFGHVSGCQVPLAAGLIRRIQEVLRTKDAN